MHALGERFGQAVGQRLEDDAAVVVGRLECASAIASSPMPGRDGKAADVVGDAGLLRRDEIGQRSVGAVARRIAGDLLAQRVEGRELATLRALVGVELDVVADAVGRPEADHRLRA